MRQLQLKNKLSGMVKPEDFEIVDVDLELNDGEFLIQNIYCSTDPYKRVGMNYTKYSTPAWKLSEVEPNTSIVGESVGQVIESKNDQVNVGTYIFHLDGWREQTVLNSDSFFYPIVKKDDMDSWLKKYLTAHCLVGRTAYYSITRTMNVQPGDVVCVSGAMGGVGHLTVQYAKIKGAKVYGITSTEQKAKKLEEWGVIPVIIPKDSSFDKKQKIFNTIPDEFNWYHENVGNEYFACAMNKMAVSSTVSFCGAMSSYNNTMPGPGPNISGVIYKDISIKGCNFFSKTTKLAYDDDWQTEYEDFVSENIDDIESIFTVYEGLESMPQQFADHFILPDTRIGKSLCKI
jgi:NADPH-dependent curcumin reductase CurA